MLLFEIPAGTDDDLPPTHQNRGIRGGRVAGNGRNAAMGGLSFSRVQTDMETEIHQLEQEAYCSVLRAFKAQSDAITWVVTCLLTLKILFYIPFSMAYHSFLNSNFRKKKA